ncbi:MAG: hypothetical protein WC477_06440 [Patescibacteria group bacterium]
MGEANFNKKQCIRALKKLGFFLDHSRRGRHDKYCPPVEMFKQLSGFAPRFIMIPRHNELHVQNEILSELKAMGGEELVRRFKEEL